MVCGHFQTRPKPPGTRSCAFSCPPALSNAAVTLESSFALQGGGKPQQNKLHATMTRFPLGCVVSPGVLHSLKILSFCFSMGIVNSPFSLNLLATWNQLHVNFKRGPIMLGGQGEQLSSAHPLEPGEPGVEGECVAVPGTGVLPGAEHCCRPTAGDFYRQAESHIMTFKRFPG